MKAIVFSGILFSERNFTRQKQVDSAFHNQNAHRFSHFGAGFFETEAVVRFCMTGAPVNGIP